jgi:hypothetical protein
MLNTTIAGTTALAEKNTDENSKAETDEDLGGQSKSAPGRTCFHVILQNVLRKKGITMALTRSMKKAETNGTMMKARWEGPKRWVTAAMLAIAVGVDPRITPPNPEAITAAS